MKITLRITIAEGNLKLQINPPGALGNLLLVLGALEATKDLVRDLAAGRPPLVEAAPVDLARTLLSQNRGSRIEDRG